MRVWAVRSQEGSGKQRIPGWSLFTRGLWYGCIYFIYCPGTCLSQGSSVKPHTKSLGDTAGIINGNIIAMNGTEMGRRWLNGSEGILLST